MITTFQAIILGLVQGLTEYLPISSSAHLVLVPELFGWHFSTSVSFIFDVLVQLGTLVGVLVYFAKDIALIVASFFRCLWRKKPFEEENARMGWFVLLATIPAAVIGIAFKDFFESYFSSARMTLWHLLLTALLLVAAEYFSKRMRQELKLSDTLWIGFAQALAIFPGVSRSGATISVGMLRGLSRESAARFSFLMSIPVMLGASLVATKDLLAAPEILETMWSSIVVGFVVAAVSGYIVIRWFLNYLKNSSLYAFAIYCGIVGVLGLIWL